MFTWSRTDSPHSPPGSLKTDTGELLRSFGASLGSPGFEDTRCRDRHSSELPEFTRPERSTCPIHYLITGVAEDVGLPWSPEVWNGKHRVNPAITHCRDHQIHDTRANLLKPLGTEGILDLSMSSIPDLVKVKS